MNIEFEGVPGLVQKLDIGDSSIYVKLGFAHGRPVWISLTLGHGIDHPGADEDKSLMEVICYQASELLATGTWTIGDVVESWIAVRNCKPSGQCPQIGGKALSPLDAAAKWLRRKYGLEG
jgi:hypothetical protein